MLKYTSHAIQRSKERYGFILSKKKIEEKGKRKEDFPETSKIRFYFDNREREENSMLVTFNSKVFVVRDNYIVTTYPLPVHLRKEMRCFLEA